MLVVEGLRKVFPAGGKATSQVVAVDDVALEVNQGEMFTLLGPSGCGKTTTLRSVAGLEEPTKGRITLMDRILFDGKQGVNVAANKREIGMVFQSYAIWPHMDVFDNVAFPLVVLPRAKRLKRLDIRERVQHALDTVQLGDLASRPATDLSGGQQQRLALARALVREPPLLLLDEPLSNLDFKLREGLRLSLKRLQRELGITTLYVTHDQVEALTMSNRIAVMNNGKVEQIGKPRDIYHSPATRFVADFIGTSNFIEGRVERKERDGLYRIGTDEGSLLVPSQSELRAGDEVTISVRPEHIRPLDRSTDAETNVLRGEVVVRGFMGESVEHEVRVGQMTLKMRCDPAISIEPGVLVDLELPAKWCALLLTK